MLRPGSNVIHVDPGSSAAHGWFIVAEVIGVAAMAAGGALLTLAIGLPEYERNIETGEMERDPMAASLWSWGAWLTGLGSVGVVGGLIGESSTETEIEHHGDPRAPQRPSSASPRLAASFRAAF